MIEEDDDGRQLRDNIVTALLHACDDIYKEAEKVPPEANVYEAIRHYCTREDESGQTPFATMFKRKLVAAKHDEPQDNEALKTYNQLKEQGDEFIGKVEELLSSIDKFLEQNAGNDKEIKRFFNANSKEHCLQEQIIEHINNIGEFDKIDEAIAAVEALTGKVRERTGVINTNHLRDSQESPECGTVSDAEYQGRGNQHQQKGGKAP